MDKKEQKEPVKKRVGREKGPRGKYSRKIIIDSEKEILRIADAMMAREKSNANLVQSNGSYRSNVDLPLTPTKVSEEIGRLIKEEGIMDASVAEFAQDPHTIPIHIEPVLNKNEYKIYLNEVSDWYESHPDWTLKEDRDDIHGIAFERVIQFRLLIKKKKSPRTYVERDYNSSVFRVQALRQNLAARRADRISNKSGIVNQTNIAIVASQLDAKKIKEMNDKVQKNKQEEDDLFSVQKY